MCKKNGIKIVILFETSLPGYSFAVDDINYQPEKLKLLAQKLKDEGFDDSDFPTTVMDYVNGIRKTYDEGKPFHFEINYPGDSGLSRHSFERIAKELDETKIKFHRK